MRILFFPFGPNDRVEIGTQGHKDRRDDAADQALAGIDHSPAAFELVMKARILQNVPSLIGSDVFQASQHRVGTFGRPSGKRSPCQSGVNSTAVPARTGRAG